MVVKWWIIQASRKAYARGLGGVSVNARHTRRGLGGGLGGSLGFECVSIQPSRKANARDLSGSLRFRCVSIQPSRKAYAGGLGGGLGGGLLGLGGGLGLGLMHPYSRHARPTPVVCTSLVKQDTNGRQRQEKSKERGGRREEKEVALLPAAKGILYCTCLPSLVSQYKHIHRTRQIHATRRIALLLFVEIAHGGEHTHIPGEDRRQRCDR